MRPLHHTQPDEATTLAMENELLRHEVVHLRARLLATGAELRRLEKETNGAGAPTAGAAGSAGSTGAEGSAGSDPSVETASDDALTDLRWLLRRIEDSPLARVLRRRDGYRRLVATYLREDAG